MPLTGTFQNSPARGCYRKAGESSPAPRILQPQPSYFCWNRKEVGAEVLESLAPVSAKTAWLCCQDSHSPAQTASKSLSLSLEEKCIGEMLESPVLVVTAGPPTAGVCRTREWDLAAAWPGRLSDIIILSSLSCGVMGGCQEEN